MAEIHEKGKKVIISEKVLKSLQSYELNSRQEKIIRYLVINERIDNEQCQKLCGSIRRTATRDLSSLAGKGLLVMRGELKGAYYVLSSTVSKL